MKQTTRYYLLLFVLPVFLYTQEKKDFGIVFSGFVKSDFFWDSRQNVSIREGHFLLYPSPVLKDPLNKDINAQQSLNFLSIQSRLTGKISGPAVLDAKTSGVLEADFFGNENGSFQDVNGFRLRHAFTKLNWEKTELLFGQFWTPLFVHSSFPGVISFNTGSPFQAFARNPQIRITQKIDDVSIIAALATQRDFQSPGGNTQYLRNSAIPEIHLQLHWGQKNDSTKTEYALGIGGEYMALRPRLSSTVGISPSTSTYKVDETFGSFTTLGFGKLVVPAFTIKIYALFGQNTFDDVMLGGYAVDTINNSTTGSVKYLPINIISTWFEIVTNSGDVQYGMFAGYTKNIGLSKELGFIKNSNIISALQNTTRGFDINSVFRIAPRIVFISGNLHLSGEIEYTNAEYATRKNGEISIDRKGKTTQTESVANIRTLFAVTLFF
jgi:hypothetical protein